MNWLMTLFAVVLFGGFLWLKPRYKILIAFFIMAYCFNIIPRFVMNWEIWDLGAVLLLITGAQMLFMKTVSEPIKPVYLTVLKFFLAWLCLSILWSLFIYHYPMLATLKASRQMIIGYLSVFIFIRLFRIDPGAFDFYIKFLYWITFFLMIICIAQHVLHVNILFMRATEYGGTYRIIPTFLPICLFLFWISLSKLISRSQIKWHEIFYILLTITVTALTYTRGIYLATTAVSLAMLFILSISRKLFFNRAFVFFAFSVSLTMILGLGGVLDRVLTRAVSGIELISGGQKKVNSKSKDDYDTFTGRIKTAEERFVLVLDKNPYFGFGFIHEEIVPPKIRNKLRYGSVISTDEYLAMYKRNHPYVLALFTADIGWANVVLYSGIVGFSLLILFILCFIMNYIKNILVNDKQYYVRLGAFLQFLVLVMLMFNGTPLTTLIQIPALLIAGYAYYTSLPSNPALES